MPDTALIYYLRKRQGHGSHDEDEEAYCLGFQDALTALLSDEVYYGALDASTSRQDSIERAVKFVTTEEFTLPR